MDGQLNLSEDEAQAELLRLLVDAAGKDEGDGLSRRELSRLTRRSAQWVLKRLQDLHDNGQLMIAKKRVTKMDGTQQWIPAYSLQVGSEDD